MRRWEDLTFAREMMGAEDSIRALKEIWEKNRDPSRQRYKANQKNLASDTDDTLSPDNTPAL